MMRVARGDWLLALLVAVPAWAQPAGLVRGPYLQTGTPTGVTVAWRTAASEGSVVKYGPSPGQLGSTATGPAGTNHVVTVGGLQPDTVYYYSVGTAAQVRAPAAGAEADLYRFRTSPQPGTRRPYGVLEWHALLRLLEAEQKNSAFPPYWS